MSTGFDSEKAVQVAALLLELNGGSMDRYALIKMIYDADRRAMERWGSSITRAKPFSMQHGPVLSEIYDLTKGDVMPDSEIWYAHITAADSDNVITLTSSVLIKDRLSKSEIRMVEEAFAELSGKTFRELKAWGHALPEYEEVGSGARRISSERLLTALGKTPDEIKNAAAEANEDKILDYIFRTP